MKKLFGELNLSWIKVIIFAVIIGVSVGLINSIPLLKDTSFTDPAIYFDLWIFFGILIIMNSKSNKDSALKCFVFFLISQPLIYLVEVPFSHLGWQLFGYYKYWFVWTILCLPMGFIGYYLKKDKWWGIIILIPMLVLTGYSLNAHLDNVFFSFPKHLLSTLFASIALIIYPLYIFNNKVPKTIGLIISIIILIFCFTIIIKNRPVYKTTLFCNSYEREINDRQKVYLENPKYGKVYVEKNKDIDEFCLQANFTKSGKTKLIIETENYNKKTYNLTIKRDTYDLKEIK